MAVISEKEDKEVIKENSLTGKSKQQPQQQQENPMVAFMYGIKSPETKRQYPRRLTRFLDFLNFDGIDTIEEQAKIFLSMALANSQWAEECFMRFVGFQLDRVKAGEIAECTISNYYKATKLFCEMNNLTLNWSRLRKGLPRRRSSKR